MKLKYRLLSYVILFVIYIFTALPLAGLNSIWKVNNINATVASGFFIINALYAFIVLKLKFYFNIVVAAIISTLSLYVAFEISEMDLFSRDPYGIATAIISNALLSIIFWEIAFSVKKI